MKNDADLEPVSEDVDGVEPEGRLDLDDASLARDGAVETLWIDVLHIFQDLTDAVVLAIDDAERCYVDKVVLEHLQVERFYVLSRCRERK